MGQMKNEEPEGERPFGRPWRRWKYIRLDLKKIRWEVVDWIHVAQDRDQWRAVVNTVKNLQVPYKEVNILTGWVTSSQEGTFCVNLVS
jgi:hypothetical protein